MNNIRSNQHSSINTEQFDINIFSNILNHVYRNNHIYNTTNINIIDNVIDTNIPYNNTAYNNIIDNVIDNNIPYNNTSYNNINTKPSMINIVNNQRTNISNQTECSICLSDFESGQRYTRIGCNHVFHSNCIQRWSLASSRCRRCPICRTFY